MYAIKLDWKEFNVDMIAVEAWVKTNAGTNYLGNSADYGLTLWYSEEPTQTDKDAVEVYWASLDEMSAEATGYVSGADLAEAITLLRVGIPAKEWADMSVAERKLVMGQTPTKAELGL